MKITNTFIIFLVSGFWHGANWTFIVWGFLNALFIMPSIVLKTNRINLDVVAKGRYLPTYKEFFQIVTTFSLTVFAWIFFRAESLNHAFNFISKIFSKSLFYKPFFNGKSEVIPIILLIFFFVIIEWVGREQQYAIENINKKINKTLRHIFYYFIIILLFWYSGREQQFIYFQF